MKTIEPIQDLPDIGAERPGFEEPWQGEAFALVVSLHRAGHFEWGEWVAALSNEIADDDGAPVQRRYY